ncbi:MAG: hypothetical protein HYZ28_23165 [Myxococcales bacterium]|nr:hypothetical protein [Myxococcales bacterium]
MPVWGSNYARMLQRLPKVEDTNAARLTLWRALGDLYLMVLKQPQDALMAYQVVAAGLPEDSPLQEMFAELAARRKDNDSAYLAARVVSGLVGDAGPGEREILTKPTPYAGKKEVAQRPLTERLWETHLLHPKIRGPISQLMAILLRALTGQPSCRAAHREPLGVATPQLGPTPQLPSGWGALEAGAAF